MRTCPRCEGLQEGLEGLSVGSKGLPEGPEGLPEEPEGLPEGPEGLSGGWGDGRTYGRTYGISPHSTGLCPLLVLLPCYPLKLHNIKEAGQVNR